MVTLGYFLSSEERDPKNLVEGAVLAERAGFDRIWISDHFHPWLTEQGQSPFVWTVLGAIAQQTQLQMTTAVTAPTMRIHPAIIAQAAATVALLSDGRFSLGVGTGEELNEHIFGDKWPAPETRLDMLEEAVAVMRELWKGETVDHQGRHYTVENARLFSCPATPPRVLVSGFGEKSTKLAARIGDGYVSASPTKELVDLFVAEGGTGVKQGGMKVCVGSDKSAAKKLAHKLWRNEGLPGQLAQDLATWTHFEQASTLVDVDTATESIVCGDDPAEHIEMITKYVEAGFDEVYVGQIGPDQEAFMRLYEKDVLPHFTR